MLGCASAVYGSGALRHQGQTRSQSCRLRQCWWYMGVKLTVATASSDRGHAKMRACRSGNSSVAADTLTFTIFFPVNNGGQLSAVPVLTLHIVLIVLHLGSA